MVDTFHSCPLLSELTFSKVPIILLLEDKIYSDPPSLMNLLIVSALDFYEPGKGHDGTPQTKTVEYYLRQGDHVTFITSNAAPKNQQARIKHRNLIIYRFKLSILDKLSTIQKVGWFAKAIRWILFQIIVYFRIKSLDESKYSIYYAYDFEAVPILWLLGKLHKKPVVSRFQGTTLSPNAKLISKFRRWQEVMGLSVLSNLTIMTNDGTQGDKVLKSLRGNMDGVHFLVNGIDQMFFKISPRQLNLANRPLYLYSCSRLVGWKNQDRNIKVIAKVLSKGANVVLNVIGDGPELGQLRCLAESLGISSHVNFIGAIEHLELSRYIENSDIYLSNYSYSNLGKTLMEAMAGGKAIITTNVGDTAAFVKHNDHGYLFDDNDLESMAEAIVYLTKNPKKIEKFGQNARIFAADRFWSWEERFAYERSLLLNLVSN